MTGPCCEDRRHACLADFTSALHTRNATIAVAARTDKEGVVVDYELVVSLDGMKRVMQEPPHKEVQRGRGR